MTRRAIPRRLVLAAAALYIFFPLAGVLEFSLRMRRGTYSFDAYAEVLSDDRFQSTFLYSCTLALVTVVLGTALIVPAAYAVRLHLPRLRGVVEFITLLPLVVPAIVIVYGYLRLYGSDSILSLTDTETGADALLAFGYVTLALPYIYRAVDAGLTAIDVRTLTEAAESLGARPATVLLRVVLPNIRSAVLSGAFITFAIVLGEFTVASLLDRPAFGPYMQLLGANRAYEPAALSLIAFALTWAAMAGISAVGGRRRGH
jgi:putative spermidine/putrescine transport system permease protein